MRSLRTSLVAGVLGVTLVAGCESASKDGGGPPPAVSVQEMNQAKMRDALVPQAVQTAFARDNPGAAIDTIRMNTTSTGETFYQVTYIRNGQAGMARYYASGSALPAAQ